MIHNAILNKQIISNVEQHFMKRIYYYFTFKKHTHSNTKVLHKVVITLMVNF